jgi:predicted nucleotidyltransferase
MNSDFKDLLRIFAKHHVEYLIVGAYAVIHYTQPRYTKDIDLWLKPSKENAARVARAFYEFGLPLVEVTQEDFESEGLQYVVGVSPCQIDFLTSLPGFYDFNTAWISAEVASIEGIPVHYLGKSDLILAKRTAGRLQDLADIEELQRADEI